MLNPDGNYVKRISEFAVADLDRDEKPEVILRVLIDKDYPYSFEILRYQDNVVYGYTKLYMRFQNLKTDGSFSTHDSPEGMRFGTMVFSEHKFLVEDILASKKPRTYYYLWHSSMNIISSRESIEDADGNKSSVYTVNKKSATEEEYLEALEEQNKKQNAIWYPFTEENVKSVLSSAMEQ